MPSHCEASVDIQVPFHDVDSYRVVWHGNYARYFEIARCELLDRIQVSYQTMEEFGYFFPVVEMRTKFVRPLVFGQRVKATAYLESWRSKLDISYRITDAETGLLLTRGKTSQVAITPDGKLLYQTPEVFVETVEAALAEQ